MPKLYRDISTFPRRVYLLMGFYIIENFAEFGLASVLSVFMKSSLSYDEDSATTLYHVYKVLECVAPLIAAFLADSYFGRFWTLIGGSVVLEIGFILISISSIHATGIPRTELFVAGVVMLAVGGGSVRISHGAFVTDQLTKGEHISLFFSLLFYLTNIVVSAGMILVPYLQRRIDCFKQTGCYPLPFVLCGVLHLVAIAIIMVGKNTYVMNPPVRTIYWEFTKCLLAGCKKREVKTGGGGDRRPGCHWLDKAEGTVRPQLIEEVKVVLSMSLLILPNICYWALYDQQGSSWTFQASRMNGNVGDVDIMPSQMQSANPLIIVALLPLYQWAVFPFIYKWTKSPKCCLHKMTTGGVFMATSFLVAAILELQVEKSYADVPGLGEAHLRVYNGLDDGLTLHSRWTGGTRLEPLTAQLFGHLPAQPEVVQLQVTEDTGATWQGQITISEKQSTSYLAIYKSGAIQVVRLDGFDTIEKDDLTRPIVQLICGSDSSDILVRLTDKFGDTTERALQTPEKTKVVILNYSSRYKVHVNGVQVLSDLDLRTGGVYSLLFYKAEGKYVAKLFTLTGPNTVHMLWQLPQYVILTTAEIFYAIANKVCHLQPGAAFNEIAHRCTLGVGNAFGDILVAVLVRAHLINKQVYYFLLYAIILYASMGIFIWLVFRYQWRPWIEI